MKRKIARITLSVVEWIAAFFVVMGMLTIGVAIYMHVFEGIFEGIAIILWAGIAWTVAWIGRGYVQN